MNKADDKEKRLKQYKINESIKSVVNELESKKGVINVATFFWAFFAFFCSFVFVNIIAAVLSVIPFVLLWSVVHKYFSTEIKKRKEKIIKSYKEN